MLDCGLLVEENEIVLSIYVFLFPMQSDTDYWLLSDGDVSITDMWRTERILFSFFSFLYCLHFFLVSPPFVSAFSV